MAKIATRENETGRRRQSAPHGLRSRAKVDLSREGVERVPRSRQVSWLKA